MPVTRWHLKIHQQERERSFVGGCGVVRAQPAGFTPSERTACAQWGSPGLREWTGRAVDSFCPKIEQGFRIPHASSIHETRAILKTTPGACTSSGNTGKRIESESACYRNEVSAARSRRSSSLETRSRAGVSLEKIIARSGWPWKQQEWSLLLNRGGSQEIIFAEDTSCLVHCFPLIV